MSINFNLKKSFFALSAVFFPVVSVFAMDQATITYTVPAEINSEALIQSSVIIKYGFNRGTGFAIGPKHIVTVAHAVVGYLPGHTIECAALKKVKSHYLVPSSGYKNTEGQVVSSPDFSASEDLKVLEITKLHFHPKTYIELSDEREKGLNIDTIWQRLNEVMQYGLSDAIKYASYGVHSQAKTLNFESKIISMIDFRVFGPDVVILECKEPHGLPILEIMDPTEERLLLHVIGLQGIRFNHDGSKKPGGSCFIDPQGKMQEIIQPAIYGQRFKCCAASEEHKDNYLWMNRVFIKIINNKFFLNDQIYPGAPKGFGLIAGGDSGSGVVAIKNGKAMLAALVSSSDIDPMFSVLAGLFENCDSKSITEDNELYGLFQAYKEALITQERDKKWFITQSLADLTHLKSWINSIINSDSSN